MEIEPVMLNQIIADWKGAGKGQKRKALETWSALLGCNVNTLYRSIPVEFKSERKPREQEGIIKGMEDYAWIVAMVKRKPPKGRKELTTDDAIEIAVDNGLIPEEMGKVAISTFNTHMRQMGLNKRTKRRSRYQAEYPNQLHHIDASSSECFYVAKALADGDAILKLDVRPHKGYKNKPVKTEERLRLWIYGLVDDYSGYHKARYIAAPGESLAHNLDFCCWTWSQIGLCEWLKADHGPMMKGEAAKELLSRLEIEIDPSIPYASESHGKIERPWRTMWHRFEVPFFVENHKTFEIKLSELIRRFDIYQEAYNQRAHRYERTVTRFQAWQRVSLRGGIVALPKDAIKSTIRRYNRTLGSDGCFSINSVLHEVKGLHSEKVWVYEGVFDNRLVVVSQATGEKYEVEAFSPLTYGEYKAPKESPHERAVKEAKDLGNIDENGNNLGLSNTLYTDSKDRGNLVVLPPRIKETRRVKDPLDVNTYPSVTEAMRDFITVSGVFLDQENREDIKALIIENGLNRRFVKELALEVAAENERSIKHG
jgi:transposase InsO family protein